MGKRFYDGLDDDIKAVLLKQIRNLWTHTSTAIEGNTLTLGDTAFLLDEGLTVSGKPLKDHEEVYGHATAIELIYRFLELEHLTAKEVFALHKAVLTERVADVYKPIGAWKNESNYTSIVTPEGKQAWREYPSPSHTPKLMAQWIERINEALCEDQSGDEAVRVYAETHLCFVTIHPFFDGNGRLARLLSNLPVLRAGFPPIVVPATDRQRYNSLISGYQATIPDLADLDDLSNLPANPEQARFSRLCEGYWSETMELVENARAIQLKRDKELDKDPGAR